VAARPGGTPTCRLRDSASLSWCNRRQDGNAEYLSVTVFEGASPQELFEFFNDDSHRLSWDDMFAGFECLEIDAKTGAEVMRWIRRFPLMCSPRDYVFSRRSWKDGDDLYTLSHACSYAACPPRARCRRVEQFFSNWRIRLVTGRSGGIATEVVLLHMEVRSCETDHHPL